MLFDSNFPSPSIELILAGRKMLNLELLYNSFNNFQHMIRGSMLKKFEVVDVAPITSCNMSISRKIIVGLALLWLEYSNYWVIGPTFEK
jgi:hypothetical protein